MRLFFWLSPSEYIFKTQIEGLQKQKPGFSAGEDPFLHLCQADVVHAGAAGGDRRPAPRLHYYGRIFTGQGAERWGEKVQKLLELCPNAKLLGLTATSVRYLDNNRDMAEELFDGCVASEMTLGEAIVRVFCLPRSM